MSWPSKKIISIILATLAGTGIILFAVGNGRFFKNKVSPKDGLGGAAGSWEDSLSIVSQNTSGDSITAQRGIKTGDEASDSATTTTGLVAQAVLTNMLLYQASNEKETISDADAQTVAQSIAKSVPDPNPVKHYTRSDIIIIPDTTESFTAYRKELTDSLNAFAQKNTRNELLIVAQALDAKDPQKLAPLDTMIGNYKKLIANLLRIKTPDGVANIHLMMIGGYATVLSGVEDMRQTFADPARGVTGFTKYQTGINIIIQVTAAFSKM